MSTSSVYTSARIFICIYACAHVYHIHTPHIHIYHGSWQDGVCIYLRICVCVDVIHSNGWESWQAQMVWFGGMTHVSVFLPALPANMMEHNRRVLQVFTPGGPLPAPTTAFSPADTSERGKTSETHFSGESTQSHHNSTLTLESDSTAVPGWQRLTDTD